MRGHGSSLQWKVREISMVPSSACYWFFLPRVLPLHPFSQAESTQNSFDWLTNSCEAQWGLPALG